MKRAFEVKYFSMFGKSSPLDLKKTSENVADTTFKV